MIPLSPPISSCIQPPLLHRDNPNALILSQTKLRNYSQAFNLFIQLSNSGFTPNEFTLASLLKASSLLSNPTSIGQQLHAKSILTGLADDPGIRTSLITMYSTSGLLDASRQVFYELSPSNSDVPLWNSIISAFILHQQYVESFRLFSDMIGTKYLVPSVATYIILLRACALSKEINMGKMLHGRIVKDRMVDEMVVLNSLITLYSKCGELRDAKEVFDGAEQGDNIVAWNAMIAGYEQNGEYEQAISLFRRLSAGGISVRPNRITLLSVLSAVSSVSDLRLGKEVHGQIIRSGLEFDTSIGNSLLTMYGRCGDVVKGRLMFDRLPSRDVVAWNSMLAGYAQNEQSENCFELFRRMRSTRIEVDDHALTVLLSAVNSCKLGREIHGYLVRRMTHKFIQISAYNAVITMYSKCNKVTDAEKIFKRMSKRDLYTWNAMMDGYSINGCGNDAINLFIDFLDQGLQFDHLTCSILLTASGKLVSIGLGKQFHALVIKHHFCSFLSINNALISMYSKCGSIEDAIRVFQPMARRDVFSWTAMITGYAHHGIARESIGLFERMIKDGIKPNSITYLGLLTACAHSSLVEEGTGYFNQMIKDSGQEPQIEHYACMVDLYGRSGQFERAQTMVEAGIAGLRLKNKSYLPLWKVLLGACHAHKQLEIGKRAAARIFELEPDDETTHVLLSNLYASFGLWKNAIDVRRQMRDRGLKKEVGCSWVEVGNKRHIFAAGDVSHSSRKEIYENLRRLDARCRRIGYEPMTGFVLHDVDESQKEAILSCHSEKLAVSFALLSREANGIIRVIKNLRVCGDCHSWMKFVSQVEGQNIILRDSRRFHSFADGNCSCGDYW